ncbi:uracil-DNA glycosylase [Telmatospirillum sp.]|uniref:uracil-DNA glycosylase n=1 Tax=Telmatospirillum sp. TaxID=2079197 RepID=UPI0028417213|nr:uracil-DNA glycosylase [Telmatospirillum sp.]MDR3435973.1 uracil-DNA glycosylase [Telmatospirillum sp.]
MTFDQIVPPMTPAQILRWYLDAGVDETIGDEALDRYALNPRVSPAIGARHSDDAPHRSAVPSPIAPQTTPFTARASSSAAAERATAAHLAEQCQTLDDLKQAMEAYDGCALKRTCQRTVFADGNPEAAVMLIGEAPGADEDRLGLPFVGASGKLLDRMLASIGLDRADTYITNVVPWRPPGNRKPEPTEVELCLPFITRHIELVGPTILVFLGGAPATALLNRHDAISRLRGRWFDYASAGLPHPVPAMPTFHPAYLLRTPHSKREAWSDFLSIRKRLGSHEEKTWPKPVR